MFSFFKRKDYFNLIFMLKRGTADAQCSVCCWCTATYTGIFLRFCSHIGYYRVLSRAPCAIQQVLTGYQFYISQCEHVNPKLVFYKKPPRRPVRPFLCVAPQLPVVVGSFHPHQSLCSLTSASVISVRPPCCSWTPACGPVANRLSSVRAPCTPRDQCPFLQETLLVLSVV